MKIILTFTIVVLILISCDSKTKNIEFNHFNEETINNFYTDVLDTIVGENLLVSKPDQFLTFSSFNNIDDYVKDSLFTSYYLRFQEFEWTNEKLIPSDSIKIIFNKENNLGWEYFRKKHGDICIINIGIPCFTPDLTTAIVGINLICGQLGGQGTQYIFTKENGQWKLKSSTRTWVS
jgi:hypothetical protein